MEWNFISENATEGDKFNLFLPEDKFEVFSSTDTFAELTVRMGVFPSLKQARKNGWGGDIPFGFNQYKIGKRIFYVWKRELTDEELDEKFKDYDD